MKEKESQNLNVFSLFLFGFFLSLPLYSMEKERVSDLLFDLREGANFNTEKRLEEKPLLSLVASRYALSLKESGFLSHYLQGERDTPLQRAREAGETGVQIGEILGVSSSAEELILAWKNSPTHLSAIYSSKWNQYGMGITDLEDGRSLVVVLFSSSVLKSWDQSTPEPRRNPPFQEVKLCYLESEKIKRSLFDVTYLSHELFPFESKGEEPFTGREREKGCQIYRISKGEERGVLTIYADGVAKDRLTLQPENGLE